MRRALALTTAIYPAMIVVAILSIFGSTREQTADGRIIDRLFPLVTIDHPPGSGNFPPGSFLASFFLPALAGMVAINVASRGRFAAIKAPGARVFYYIAGVLIAILGVAGDTLLPLLDTQRVISYRLVIAGVHAGFLGAVLMAQLMAVGAEREW